MTLLVCHPTHLGQKRPLQMFLTTGFPPPLDPLKPPKRALLPRGLGSVRKSHENTRAIVGCLRGCARARPSRMIFRGTRRVTKNGTVCHLYHTYARFTITVLEPNGGGWLCFHSSLLWLVQSVGFLGQENCFLLAVEGTEAEYPTPPLSHHPTLAKCS